MQQRNNVCLPYHSGQWGVYDCFDGGKREKFIGSSADKSGPDLTAFPHLRFEFLFWRTSAEMSLFASLLALAPSHHRIASL